MRARVITLGWLLVFALTAVAAAVVSQPGQWRPLGLVVLLVLVAIGGGLAEVQTRSMRVSGELLAIVLAMALLGPAPAAAIGVTAVLVDSIRSRPPIVNMVSNFAAFAAYPLVGGLIVQWVTRQTATGRGNVAFLLVVLSAFVIAISLNFLMIAINIRFCRGIPILRQVRTVFLPVLPSEIATALLAMATTFLYLKVGLAALVLASVVLFTFQYLVRELLRSQERAEELVHRTEQLASLQVGVLTAMLQTLSLRDRMTARHSAAVARYAREIAEAAGCSTEEQDLVHTAALLHDIGKFIFPDSLLFASTKLSAEEWEIVKRHPGQGAHVVRRVDGYGPVADIILSHHERVDGTGYPAGLSGEEIPLGSRIISVADTYDVMTARDSYRQPVGSSDAIKELRRVAGAQLDGRLVELFIGVLERKGVRFRHADDADFEAELAFEHRVRAFTRGSPHDALVRR